MPTPIDYARRIDQMLAAVAHIESPAEAARALDVSDGTLRRWREGDRSMPRGKVKKTVERWRPDAGEVRERGSRYPGESERPSLIEEKAAAYDRIRPLVLQLYKLLEEAPTSAAPTRVPDSGAVLDYEKSAPATPPAGKKKRGREGAKTRKAQ